MKNKTKMKKNYIHCLFLSVFIITMGFTLFSQEGNLDILPLGTSPYKFTVGKIEKDQVIESATEKTVTIADIVKKCRDTDVFIIGEAHNSYECHTFQRDFIEALYKENPKLVVGFEFFLREDNDALASWLEGKISEAELLQKSGWYAKTSLNFAYTRLVMDIIKKYKIKVIGLNIPREILRKVSRQGYDTLPAEEKKLFPTIGIYNREHEYFIKSVFGAFAVQVPIWFKNVYTAQKCWDVVMAESMRQLLASEPYKGYKGVIIAGSNHVAYKLGIPFRYNKADRKTALTTIVPVFLPEEKIESSAAEENPMMKMLGKSLPLAAVYSRGIADYVFSISKPEFEFFPAFGMSVELQDGKIEVTVVEKNSIAERNGLRKGDIILAVDDSELTSLEQMRTILALKNWDDSVGIKIAKKIEIKKPTKEETKEEIKQ